jgi:hypothetical protein
MRSNLERRFAGSAPADDKVHLHVVSTMDLPMVSPGRQLATSYGSKSPRRGRQMDSPGREPRIWRWSRPNTKAPLRPTSSCFPSRADGSCGRRMCESPDRSSGRCGPRPSWSDRSVPPTKPCAIER